MRTFAVMTALIFATPALATISEDAVLGTTMDEVKATLAEMGYQVRKLEIEDGMIEAYFVGENEMGEVYVDPETGKVVRLKLK